MDNLIDQRRRNFYLDGHRMGDNRRYLKYYQRNYFPTGSYLGSTTVSYANITCWPINTAEITNNPMVPNPYTVPTGP